MESLKDCPFCGSNAMSHTEPTRSVVGCFNAKCGVNPSLNATTMKRGSELWNKRVNDRLEQEVAELRDALQQMVEQFECDHNCEYEFKLIKASKQLLNK